MRRLTLTLTLAAMGLALAACGEKPAEPAAPAPTAPAAADAMAGMDMAGATMAKGTGTVTAVDKTAGSVTIDHGPIAEANWPAMEMEFKATPATLLDSVKVGDKVAFELKMSGGTGEVTAIKAE
jgi:Cu(I)/Ag(I) efflux system protein CusF